LRQIHGFNRLYVNRRTGEALGLADDDWVWVISRTDRVKCQVRLMEGVNPDTVWTWNAIGKRAGAWALKHDAPEFRRAFLLNHVIAEYLPKEGGETAQSNSDPVTGQAAWFDLTVAIERCGADEPAEVAPRLGANPLRLKQPPRGRR
jgi:anaerobic selenocysteine-containing dehydrogenase